MDNINEINSYNSITMSPGSKKELRVSTSYSSTKINIATEFNKSSKILDLNNFKRVSKEIYSNPQRTSINTDKAFTSTQNISTKDEDSSSSILTKLPIIHKQIGSNSLNGSHNIISNNYLLNDFNSPLNSNQKDYLIVLIIQNQQKEGCIGIQQTNFMKIIHINTKIMTI